MRILIDIDNTIENLLKAWCEAATRYYGSSVKPEDIRTWDIENYFPGLTPDQVFALVKTPGFWDTCIPEPGAVEYVKRLIDDGHEVYLCSATDWIDCQPKYEQFIRKYFPFITWKNIIIIANKQIVKTDVMVDDGIHNLVGGDYVKILYTKPFNEYYNAEENGIIRADTWAEIYAAISGLAAGQTK